MPLEDLGQVAGALRVQMLGEHDRALGGPRAGSRRVGTSASIPPAEEPITMSWEPLSVDTPVTNPERMERAPLLL